jgi:hypothetical protein
MFKVAYLLFILVEFSILRTFEDCQKSYIIIMLRREKKRSAKEVLTLTHGEKVDSELLTVDQYQINKYMLYYYYTLG